MSRRQQRELCVAEALSLFALCTREVAGSGPRYACNLAAACNEQPPKLTSINPEQPRHSHNPLWRCTRPPKHSVGLHGGIAEQYANTCMEISCQNGRWFIGNRLSYGITIIYLKAREKKTEASASAVAKPTHTHTCMQACIHISCALGSRDRCVKGF